MNYFRFWYFTKKHLKELLSFFAAVITAYISFRFNGQPGNVFSISILVTIFFSVVSVYFLMTEKDFYYIPLDKYSSQEQWFGSGIFKLNKQNKSYEIGDSDAGFIFSKCLGWSNYLFTGDFKILKDNLGIIIRATNLSNYIKLEITTDSVRPQFIVNGGSLVQEVKETGLTFEKKIIEGKWYNFGLVVSGDEIEIIIREKKKYIMDKTWDIKKGYSNPKITIPIHPKEDEKRVNHTHNLDVPVNYDYGSVGFKCGHKERALIKNILIKNL